MALRVAELRDKLVALRINSSGLKTDLQNKLVAYYGLQLTEDLVDVEQYEHQGQDEESFASVEGNNPAHTNRTRGESVSESRINTEGIGETAQNSQNISNI